MVRAAGSAPADGGTGGAPSSVPLSGAGNPWRTGRSARRRPALACVAMTVGTIMEVAE
ncbi:hypothetical protein F610DRAFT_05408 [Streptomyces sp. LaPpAH-199]|nr:hypothetical protein F610DRAFT_05408 [Streptomyces sp. LaPpAH-199]